MASRLRPRLPRCGRQGGGAGAMLPSAGGDDPAGHDGPMGRKVGPAADAGQGAALPIAEDDGTD
eukprot:11296854-Alexandrium_andersonii.AAC.1